MSSKPVIDAYDSFVIMPFGRNSDQTAEYFDTILKVIRRYLEGLGLVIHRADDRSLAEYIWHSVVEYMQSAEAGIVVLDDRGQGYVSQNVMLELGYMLALGKPLLILREASAPKLIVDLQGRDSPPYNADRINEDIPKCLEKWIKDRELVPPVIGELGPRLAATEKWVMGFDWRKQHILLMNFSNDDETFLFCVRFLHQFYQNQAQNQFVQLILRPRRPKFIVEMLLRQKTNRDKQFSFEDSPWLRAKNATLRHLPQSLNPQSFIQHWFSKVNSQLPDKAECLIICENTSEYMRSVNNKAKFVEYEQSLHEHRDEYFPDKSIGIICTYQWSDISEMIASGDIEVADMMNEIADCHDEILVLTKENEWITGAEARHYLRNALATLHVDMRRAKAS